MTRNVAQKFDNEEGFRWAFSMNKFCLKILGVWPTKENKSKFLWLSLLIATYIFIWDTLPGVYAFVLVYREINLAVDNLMTTIGSSVGALKIVVLWSYQSTCQLLMQWAKADWYRHNENWQRELMLKQAGRGRLLSSISYAMMFLHVTIFLLSPVFDLDIRIVNNITDPDLQHYLPLQSYYPFEFFKSPYYELTYLSQVIAVSCSGCAYASVDLFFMTLVFHASGQSEILTAKMIKLCDGQTHASFRDRLQELIESHNHLVRFVNAIEDCFSSAIFIQMFGSMLLICGAGYALCKAFDEASKPDMAHIGVLVAQIVNINEFMMLYCLTCEVLASNSSELYDAIYNSQWYELPPKEAQSIILIMARTQRPLQLSAGKFFYLSLNAYAHIVKSTVGYISMLLTVS